MNFENTSNPEYSNFIALSRYARWLPSERRRESWDETVERYISLFKRKFPDIMESRVNDIIDWGGDTSTDRYDNISMETLLTDAIRSLDVMPSMRLLMTAGKALELDNVAGFNPVSGETRVITKELGNTEICELVGKSYQVLNKEKEWTKATFNSYGVQELKEVVLRLNSNSIKIAYATQNHRWVLSNGIVKSTDDLEKGDKIDFVSAPKPVIDEDYILGVRHGLIYGDGTATKSFKRVKGYHIRLCGNSSEQLEWFDGYPVTYPPSMNGDPLVMMYDSFSATHSLKELPPEKETDSYLLGFIRGWLAADGSVTKSSQVSLCTANEGKEWLIKNAERIGFSIQRIYKQSSETNYGKRRKDSFILYFSRSSMTEEDILCSWKRRNFRPLKSYYIIDSINDTDRVEEVFCADVPETNTFTLEGGLITGNCSYTAINRQRVFDEIMYILMCGTGVGFSVERQYIHQLPTIAEEFFETDTTIIVADSKIGWASALRELISLLYSGKIPRWNLSKVRPAGAPLKTFGGRASGPDPLDDLFRFCVEVWSNARGRKLTSLECHDVVCKIGEVVVVGGVRRSACISLSNLSDERMRSAKSGEWWSGNPQRALANNSVCYTEKPDIGVFMREWLSLYESKSGERGIFNREASKRQAASNGRRDAEQDFGTNPCSEIILRDRQFCNLTEIVVRAGDSLDDLRRKATIAAILGTFQATLTNFRYLSKKWRENTEEEALLGVSMTGIMDHPILSGREEGPLKEILEELRNVVVNTNGIWADKLGVEHSAATTCVKPSGTVSQLVDSASGIHPRYSSFYIRTVRADKKDPLSKFMENVGFPVESDITKPDSTNIFSFPMRAPDGSVFRNDMSAIDQLEHWLVYQRNWCEHKPSITVYVREDEWMEVGAWVYSHFDEVSGVSFLPHSDHSYKQAPYQEITEKEYMDALGAMPENVKWEELGKFEEEDTTAGSKTYACSGDSCEVVDLI